MTMCTYISDKMYMLDQILDLTIIRGPEPRGSLIPNKLYMCLPYIDVTVRCVHLSLTQRHCPLNTLLTLGAMCTVKVYR